MRAAPLFALALTALIVPIAAACGSDDPGSSNEGAPTPSESSTNKKPGSSSTSSPDEDSGTTPGNVGQCPRTPKAPDHARKVVVSHPFGAGGAKAKKFEVLELSAAGDLTRLNKVFEMGRSLSEIAFTPDGEIGITAQEDGSLGVFKIDASGAVTVVHAAFKDAFYAHRVVMGHDGTRAFVLDQNTKENGGGVYEVKIGCDGTLTYTGHAIPGGKAHAMALNPADPERGVLVAGAAFDSPANDYAHSIDFAPAKPVRILSTPVFPDQNAIASWVAITPDGKWALVTDNGLFGGNRMAPVNLATMKAGTPIPVANPAAVVMSPFGNAALLLESDGEDHLRLVTYDAANTTAPFAVGPEVAYKNGKSQLPLLASVIDRGTLKGRVIVAENEVLRQLAFDASGAITDVGQISFEGDIGFDGILGALGVEP